MKPNKPATHSPDKKTLQPSKERHFQGLEESGIARDALDLLATMRELDLTESIAELEITGLTVIPPEKLVSCPVDS